MILLSCEGKIRARLYSEALYFDRFIFLEVYSKVSYFGYFREGLCSEAYIRGSMFREPNANKLISDGYIYESLY